MKRGDQQSDFPSDGHPSGGTSSSRPETQNNGGPDDPVLLEAALRGDIEAFAGLFERYRQRLYALCLKRLADSSLAEDVVQEVFIRAFISLPNSDYRRPLWPWLATIASRMCIGLQRRRSYTDYSEDIEPAMEADANRRALDNGTNQPLDAVIASEKRAELSQSLQVLSKRQRRVFLLYALDGWSCSDIAAAEGISVGAVHLLLFRARRKMRSLRENGPLPAIVFPFGWLRWKFQRVEERIRPLLGVYGEGLSSACVQLVCIGALAMMMAGPSHPVEPLDREAPIRSEESVLSVAQSQTLQITLPNGTPPKASVEPQQSAANLAGNSLVDGVINSNQNATPENSSFGSLTVSPNYESDHTILTVGHSAPAVRHSGPRARVLFVSHDGGASWKPRPSRLLEGSEVLLPPRFPQDGRIFVFGGMGGLRQSDDGGEIFRIVSPIEGGSVAISPSFGSGTSKILMGGDHIFEFDTGTGLTQPALLTIPLASSGEISSIAFPPSYPSDSTVFVAVGSDLYRCKELVCDKVQHPNYGPLKLRFSPRCDQVGLAYAFMPWGLIVSNDGVGTLGKIQFPIEYGPSYNNARSILDVAILCNTSSDTAIFASTTWTSSSGSSGSFSQSLSGIYRSFDAGRSWSKTWIGLPGFGFGAAKLTVTPTGRLLASGTSRGIACSEDFGETWASRCTPEP